MKRKRTSDDLQACDLVLTDASGRSVRAHRALLMDKSDYFAQLLNEHALNELQFNEIHLVELIHYLYSRESDYAGQDLSQLSALPARPRPRSPATRQLEARPHGTDQDQHGNIDVDRFEGGNDDDDRQQHATPRPISPIDTSLISGDIEILMHLLVLAKKYSFKQLHNTLLNEINYKLSPLTAITVYKCARELNLPEFQSQTRMMILSWLPRLQSREDFLSLSEEAIYDIFNAENADIECDSKLDALSVWWSRNNHVDLTDLWVKIMMSNESRK